jgi:ADP-heptose:LPS heptosyltransferase
MNFPGLGPVWSSAHHALHAAGAIRPWSLDESHEALARGEKVLIVASTALGDSLLTTPLVETMSHHLGRDRVSLLVKKPYADLYRDDPRLHRLFTVRGKYRWENLRRELQANPHKIALLSNMTEPDLIPWLGWCGVRGFLRYRTRWTRFPRWMANLAMLRRPGMDDYATGHAIENNLAMAEALGLEPTTNKLSLPHLRNTTGTVTRRVLIHPGASRESKCWPVENWAALADALAGKFHCAVALTGDRSEVTRAEAVAAKMQSRAEILAGRLSLSALAEAQAQSLAFLSGDTGPYHIALAVGCPTATLFAPTDRGSSIEACGPHQADPVFHRALQTAKLGDAIATIPLEQVVAEASAVVAAALARSPAPATA